MITCLPPHLPPSTSLWDCRENIGVLYIHLDMNYSAVGTWAYIHAHHRTRKRVWATAIRCGRPVNGCAAVRYLLPPPYTPCCHALLVVSLSGPSPPSNGGRFLRYLQVAHSTHRLRPFTYLLHLMPVLPVDERMTTFHYAAATSFFLDTTFSFWKTVYCAFSPGSH